MVFSGNHIHAYFFFFFSSRRRHTRWPRDWSSDVCSSDLGNLQGRVVSPQPEPVAEVRITITGPSLQGTRTTQPDRQGFFQVLALPAGSYRVRLERIGFRPVVVDSVLVRIGSTTNLGLVTIEPEAVQLGEITVSAQRLSVDPASTTVGANVDASTYNALPVGRDYRSVVAF